MTYVSGNRGVKPLYSPSASSPLHSAGQRKSGQIQGPHAQPVRFGRSAVGNTINNFEARFVDHTLPLAENVTEVFICGFIAQDVVAMWLPRIYALLTEGRKNYDPQHDPMAQGKPFATQANMYVKGNLKGLNWDNFYEGTKREFATGPGLLIVPACGYLVASRLINPAIKLPYPALKGMGKGLAEQFGDKVDQAQVKEQVKLYLQRIFQDPLIQSNPAALEFGKNESLEKWAGKWVDNYFCQDAAEKKKATKELSDELQNTIRSFNRKHRMAPYDLTKDAEQIGKNAVNRLIHDEHPLHRTESTWVSYQPERLEGRLKAKVHPKTSQLMTEEMQLAQAGKCLKQMPVTEVLRDLTRMEGLVKDIEKRATKNTGTLAEAARQTMEHMVKLKFGMSLGATALTAAYLTKLAFWAQNHNTYQATRLLNEKTAQNHGSQSTDAANARSHRASQPPPNTPIAGSANALQPAFSMAARTQVQPFARPTQMPTVSPFAQPQPWPLAQPDGRRNA